MCVLGIIRTTTRCLLINWLRAPAGDDIRVPRSHRLTRTASCIVGGVFLKSNDTDISRYNEIRYSRLFRMTVHWYVVKSKPNKEDFLARQLEAHEIRVFYPRLRVKPVNPRARKTRPYFPGYLFVNVDLTIVGSSTLQWMAGAANLVSFGGEPAPVPEGLVNAIEKRVEEINASNKTGVDNMKRGEPVRIQAGPFAGYEAIFDGRVSGQERVRVLLRFLEKRQVAIELEGDQVLRVRRS